MFHHRWPNMRCSRFAKVLVGGLALLLGLAAGEVRAQGSGRLTYLTENNPWYPHTEFPKLITPQWVGEEGVEAVVILAIDDMRESAKYEGYLRPILQRLKQIDGRAPVSIMTCKVKPNDQRIQTWLDEGLSIEVHTVDHPCPLLKGGDFAAAKSTYDRCVDLLGEIPGSRPVAFRMPCCDSLNTVSPRFFSEIFDRTTENGNFLHLSSSVFNVFTPEDRSIPRELLFDEQGRERFRRYIPHQSNTPPKYRFNNFIENYPYPFVINRTCWEFPCVVPSDWEAQFLQKPNNPRTVADMQAAIDITVHKQGVFCLVFHPHGWIQNDQVVELIDHAVKQHGKKVKFLTFAEALQRLNRHLLNDEPLRDEKGRDNGVRIVDVNQDGYLDVLIGNEDKQQTRLWQPLQRKFTDTSFPAKLKSSGGKTSCQFATGMGSGSVKVVCTPAPGETNNDGEPRFLAKTFQNGMWVDHAPLTELLQDIIKVGQVHPEGPLENLLFHQESEHGSSLALVTRKQGGGASFSTKVFWWSAKPGVWQELRAQIPAEVAEALAETGHPRLRFVDLDEDGEDDLVLSPKPGNASSDRLKFWLLDWFATGKATELPLADSVKTMPIVRDDGSDNGFFVRDRHLCWQNEDTDKLPNLLHRVSFDDILAEQAAANAKAGELPPPRTPEQSAALIQVRPGMRVELVASEPLIRDPVAFDWDIAGRLWVVEMGGYPNGTDGQGQGGGRVQVLTDTDRDGRYDKATTFLDGLNFPTGIQHWRNGILVTAAPEIFYAEDTDGDGKADVRKTLYRGFVEGNQQHRVNGLRWGLENWLYVANGDSGGMIEAVDSLRPSKNRPTKPVSISGRDLRIRPDEGLIDPQSGQSQFGRNRDDWGNWFGCNNSHPMWHYALEDHYLRRNPHTAVRSTRYEVPAVPGAAPVFPASRTLPRFNDLHTANRFTSACGTMIYRDHLLGEEFSGNAFISEPVHNLVSRLVLTRNGTTFTAKRAEDELDSEFLASRDNWFRPTMLRTGPDGALWVADMYRAVIEHPKWIPVEWQEKLDLRAGHSLGRIYKVVPESAGDCCLPFVETAKGNDAEESLRCFITDGNATTEALVERLASPSGWWRDTAQRMLIHRGGRAAVPLLEAKARDHQNPLARLHALCTLEGLGALTSPVLLQALSDSHPSVRAHAVRLSGPGAKRDSQLADAITKRLDDDDAMVLMQLAYTAGELPKQSAGAILASLLQKQPANEWLTAAALSSLNADNLEIVLRNAMNPKREMAVSSPILATLIGQAAAFGEMESLKALLAEGLPRSDEALDSTAWQTLATVTAAIQKQPQAWKAILADATLKERLSSTIQQALHFVKDRNADLNTRIAALKVVGVGAAHEERTTGALADLLVPQSPDALQKAVVAALTESGRTDVPKRLLAGWRGHSPSLRAAILDALLERQQFRAAVLEALENQTIATVDVDTVRRERLLRTGSKKDQQRAAAVFADSANSNRQDVLKQFAAVLKMPGDAARGRQIFEKRCAACHKLDGIGKSIGADLEALKDRSTGAMLTAILDPNRAIEAKFLSFTAATEDGRTFSGMLLTETGTSITLIGSDGKEHILLRSELEVLQGSNRSLMPEGFEKDMTAQDLADVIRFVQSNAEPRKSFSGNKPRTVSADETGTLTLPASAAEIFGPSIVFEEKFQNLGYWSSEQDHADWLLTIPQAGEYDVVLDYAVHKSAAGNTLQLTVAGSKLSGSVPSTGVWENYQKWNLGTVQIPEGTHRLIVSTPSPPRSALIDLRTLWLKPVEK